MGNVIMKILGNIHADLSEMFASNGSNIRNTAMWSSSRRT